jgi:putative peptidoglycan lipid II flippase
MSNRTMLKWAGIVTVLLVFSRLLGFLRETAIAYRFGTTAETDAYLVAAVLPQILFLAFNDAVKTAFIPVYGEYHRQGEGNAFALTVYVLLGAVLFVSSFVLVLAAPLVVRLVAPGFSGETYEIAVVMSRILLPGLMFMGLSGLSAGVLHTKKNFVTPAIVAFPSNLIIIVGAVFFGVRYGIVGLAWATIVGIASQFLIQLPAVARTGVFTRDKLLWKHPGLKKMAVLLPPVLLGGAALELKSIIDRVFGSLLPEGSIAALNFSNRIYLLPHSILILALLTVIYPTLVELHVEAKVKEFKETLRQGIGLMIVSITPMMAGLIVLRVPVVRLLFERGAFDVAATESTAFALAFYSLGLVGVGWQLLMNRAFYAMKDTVTPMVVTLVLVVMNIVFNWFLIKPLGHGGIALGTALSINVGTVLVWYLLRKKIGPFGGGRILNTLWKSVLASLVMAAVITMGMAYLGGGGFARQAVELGALIMLGGIVYFVMVYALRVEELQLGLSLVRRKFGR